MVISTDNRDDTESRYSIFRSLLTELSDEERKLLKGRLASQIPTFFDINNNFSREDVESRREFKLLARMLRAATPGADSVPFNGIAYRGFPSWLNESLIARLQDEAETRREEPLDRTDHFLGCGGDVADLLSVSPEILSFVEGYTGQVRATGIASYLYYDWTGSGIRPHVDTDVFSVNMMIMLRHDASRAQQVSSTRIFPAEGPTEDHYLKVGEVMIMHGNSVVHTRSPLRDGEIVHLLTIGFSSVGQQ